MKAALLPIMLGYLLGSLPTGVYLSRKFWNRDIREFGDGNSGARNMAHVLGWKAGFLTGLVDFLKGLLAELLTGKMSIHPEMQLLAGFAAVLGHDFPVFVGFKGGQGMAASLGTMSVLFPNETLIGLAIFGFLYLLLRHFDFCASLGLGTLAFLVWRSGQPSVYLMYVIALFLSIPLKKLLDFKTRKPNLI